MIALRGLVMALLLPAFIASAGCASEPKSAASTDPTRSIGLPPAEGAKANIAVAEQFDHAGQAREAIRHYELARALDPEQCQWVARRLGRLYDRIGDDDRAEIEYAKAYKLDPNNVVLLNDMGYFYYSCGRYDDAKQVLQRALEINPSFDRAWINLGLTHGAQEQYHDAYEAFLKAVTPAESRANVALVMAHNGDYAQAENEMRQAIDQQPNLQRFKTVIQTIQRERGATPPGSQ